MNSQPVWRMTDRVTHVCFVAPNAYPLLSNADYGISCGAEVQQFLIAEALLKHGHRVTFVVDDFGQEDREVHHSIEVIKGPFRYLGGSNIHFFVDTVKLVLLLRKIGADFNVLKTPVSLLFAMSLHRRLFGRKLIKIIAHDQDCIRPNNKLVSKLYPWGTRALDYTIFQSEHQKQRGLKNLGLKGKVIKNMAHAMNCKCECPKKDIDVLWIGSSERRKRPDVFLDLAEQLSQVKFTMVMADGLDKQFHDQIEERARSVHNMDYKGFVPYHRTWNLYRRAKILACTSDAEGFPNIFLQAWQASIPVVSLTVDPDNVIRDNRLGFVSGCMDKMKKDINSLLADASLRSELGRNGRDYVQKNHAADVIAGQFLSLFESLKS